MNTSPYTFSTDTQLVVISNNCWGGCLYQHLKREYRSPFVGLFVPVPCYIGILENLHQCMASDIKFTDASKYDQYKGVKYPIGLICGKYEVHFVHYKNTFQAQLSWKVRAERLTNSFNGSPKVIIKLCDRDYFNPKFIDRFMKISYGEKVLFSVKDYGIPENIVVACEGSECVADGYQLFHETKDVFIERFLI